MVILETQIFTRRVADLISDEGYRELQSHLVSKPDSGTLIPRSGGLRKIRWSAGQKGKRGGARFIYYWVVRKDQIVMLMVYAKNEQTDLTPGQLRMLRRVVEEEFK